MLKKLPIGIQDFEKLIENNYLYVDKTALIHELVHNGCYYFLSRPRRFGKSLLMSTLHAYFSGKKDLFKGLAMENLEKEWIEHPVLHLDLNTQKYDSGESLEFVLDRFLKTEEARYGLVPGGKYFGPRFESVINAAYGMTGRKVVILVDEYDKPILQAIGNESLQDEYRSTLKSFYGALKTMDGCIKFALLTGVTKFGKVSVFSDLNNLEDISMNFQYHDICGITQEEMKDYCYGYIKNLAQAQGFDIEQAVEKLRIMYDGYHFHPNGEGIYNPFSLLNCLKQMEFKSYWFETGTPSYLVKLLQLHEYNLEKMSHAVTSYKSINSIDANSTNPIPVIYQSGYLTIKGYDQRFGTYTLGFPNKEVEQGFMDYLLPYYAHTGNDESSFTIQKFVLDIESGNTEGFITRLKSFFSDTPYDLIKDCENHYQNVIFIISRLMGYYVRAEYRTSAGRIDLLLQSRDYTYIIELKHGGSAKKALQQIKDKEYDLPYRTDSGRTLILIGMNIDPEKRNINEVEIEQ